MTDTNHLGGETPAPEGKVVPWKSLPGSLSSSPGEREGRAGNDGRRSRTCSEAPLLEAAFRGRCDVARVFMPGRGPRRPTRSRRPPHPRGPHAPVPPRRARAEAPPRPGGGCACGRGGRGVRVPAKPASFPSPAFFPLSRRSGGDGRGGQGVRGSSAPKGRFSFRSLGFPTPGGPRVSSTSSPRVSPSSGPRVSSSSGVRVFPARGSHGH
jgi:hypothetical protein